MKNFKTPLLLVSFYFFLGNYNLAIGQSGEKLKIEKKLESLYDEKGKLKKCNRIAKRYIKKSKTCKKGINTASYYAALTYLYYGDWNETGRRIVFGNPYIMETHPINFVDSVFKYSDLYLKTVDSGSISIARWQVELYDWLDFEINFRWANQLILHKYPECGQEPELIYAAHKEECDSILAWKRKLYQYAKHNYPKKLLEKYFDYISYKNDFLGLDLSIGQLDTIYHEFYTYMALNDRIEYYSSMLPEIMQIDTAQFYRFLHLIEAYDTSYTNSDHFNWRHITIGYGYGSDKYVSIWEPLKSTEDAGTFLVNDSIRTNKIGYTYTYSILFKYRLYPGDMMRFHKTNNQNFVITNLNDLQNINGSGIDTITVQFSNPSAHYFTNDWEWDKRQHEFAIMTSRGKYYFEFLYRIKYVE